MLVKWLEKATFTSGTDLAAGGLLAPEQARQFIIVAINEAAMFSDIRLETSQATKFEVPRLSFGSRILRNGTEAVRLPDADRVKPATGLVTLSTVLFKGEVLVSDETFEDNVEQAGLADTIMAGIAGAVGRDAEEIAIKADTARIGGEDTTLDQLDGWIKQMQTNLPTAQKINAGTVTTATELFRLMVEAMPARYRRDYSRLRLYVPTKIRDAYEEALSARGTSGGDRVIMGDGRVALYYRGIPVKEVPIMIGTDTINSASVDYSKFSFLADPQNLIVGWHRRIRVEKFRDPRDGATSFLPTVRFDAKFGVPDAAVLASGIAL